MMNGTQPSLPAGSGGPAAAPLRRLSRTEYDHTVKALLGDATSPGKSFSPEDTVQGGIPTTLTSVTALGAEQFVGAAETVAERAVAGNLTALLGCDPRTGEDPCADKFIRTWVKRAFRRPLEATEVTRFIQLYQGVKQKSDFRSGVQAIIEMGLQSPHFLYRPEFGVADPAAPAVMKLTPWEVASRLSYLLLQSMPDDQLFQAAESNQLATREQILAQARRLVRDPRTREIAASFTEHWLELERVLVVPKDASSLAGWNNDLRPHFRQETRRFLDHVMWEDAPAETMFSARFSFMNKKLASYYGLTGPTSDALERVTLDGVQRIGFLTHVSVLAGFAGPVQTSPVGRGKFVRSRLLCTDPPPPPPGTDTRPPDPDSRSSTRQRFEQHRNDPACANCHALMDPIGFAFENYDAGGRWRTMDGGRPVDASGDARGSDVPPFVGAVDLAGKLATSQQALGCLALQWFRHSSGRLELPEDQATIEALTMQFMAASRRFEALFTGLTELDGFTRIARAVPVGGRP